MKRLNLYCAVINYLMIALDYVCCSFDFPGYTCHKLVNPDLKHRETLRSCQRSNKLRTYNCISPYLTVLIYIFPYLEDTPINIHVHDTILCS